MSASTLVAVAIVLLLSTTSLILAARLPLWLARRAGRAVGLIHLEADALKAVPLLQQLVIESPHVITSGQLVVIDVEPLDPADNRNLRWFAGALAHRADDPLNRAIAKLAGPGRITGVAADPSFGLRGSVDRHPVRIGRADWLDPGTISLLGSTVGVEVDHRPLGRISVADEVRRDADVQVECLRHAGIHPVLVSTADEPNLARVAELAGIEEWHAGAEATDVARKLGGSRAGVGRATVRSSDAHHGAGPESRLMELALPMPPEREATVLAEDTSIAALVTILGLLQHSRLARLRGWQVACAYVLVLLPIAALGLVSLPVISGLALGAPALTATAIVLGIAGAPRMAEDDQGSSDTNSPRARRRPV